MAKSRRLKKSLFLSIVLHASFALGITSIFIFAHTPYRTDVPIEIQLMDVHVHRAEAPTEAPQKVKRTVKARPAVSQALTDKPAETESAQPTWEQFSTGERNEYLASLIRLISKYKYYPKASILNEEEGVVHVRVSLGSDGKLISSEVSKGSGYSHLDEAALKTIRDIGQFPLPSETIKSLTLLIPIRYEMNPNH